MLKPLTLFAAIAFGTCSIASAMQAMSPSQVEANLSQALVGDWVGLLEYRDYSEPAASTKREHLPTWLSISPAAGKLNWHYIYDDGPNKVVEEADVVHFDVEHAAYTESDNGKPEQSFKVTGYETLQQGRGKLLLLCNGTDNAKPAEIRVTLTIRRNLLEVLQESRPAGSAEEFSYRHFYRFTRAHPWATTGIQ